jgi:hypothetical protein
MIWPWIDEELDKVWAIRDDSSAAKNAGVTASSFLVFLKHLHIIIMQDATMCCSKQQCFKVTISSCFLRR